MGCVTSTDEDFVLQCREWKVLNLNTGDPDDDFIRLSASKRDRNWKERYSFPKPTFLEHTRTVNDARTEVMYWHGRFLVAQSCMQRYRESHDVMKEYEDKIQVLQSKLKQESQPDDNKKNIQMFYANAASARIFEANARVQDLKRELEHTNTKLKDLQEQQCKEKEEIQKSNEFVKTIQNVSDARALFITQKFETKLKEIEQQRCKEKKDLETELANASHKHAVEMKFAMEKYNTTIPQCTTNTDYQNEQHCGVSSKKPSGNDDEKEFVPPGGIALG